MISDYRPSLTEEEYDRYMSAFNQLVVSRRIGELSENEYAMRLERLDSEFQSLIDFQDIMVFGQISGLQEALTEIMPPEIVDSYITHELQHGNKARELGYAVNYGIFIMIGNSGNLVVAPFTQTLGKSCATDFDKIRRAPGVLSRLDKI